ncbi:MAG TPA: hypothetical protein VFQ67_17960 [Allosphingosinicella sp.]|jgi:hypothetical protein|nr:hypothetical protein [Allosphingosinicella sp.]
MLIGLSIAAAAAPAGGSGAALFEDATRGVSVRYEVAGGRVDFSAELPAGWTFSVLIDGDQDGKWGNGAGIGAAETPTSEDRTFGQDARGGVFCAQYILASRPEDPSQVLASSDCDAYPSRGWVEMGQLDRRGRARITYRIPSAEIFGSLASAHLQLCVWDSKRWSCRHGPARPFVLRRP